MKKSKLFVLAAMAALTLVGCGGSNSGSGKGNLPSGGKEVDVTSETGKATLKERLNNTAKAYADLNLESFAVKSTTSDINVEVGANAEMQGMKINAKAAVKNVGAVAEFKASKADDGSTDMSLVVNNVKGSVSLSGSFVEPSQEEEGKTVTTKFDSSLNLGGVELAAYVSGSKAYVDASKGVDGLVGNVDTFANDLLGDLSKSPMLSMVLPSLLEEIPFYNAEEGKVNFKGAFDALTQETGKKVSLDMGEAVPFPVIEIEAEGEIEGLDEAVEAIAALAEQKIGLKFETYSKGGFGFQLNVTKESLKTLVAAYAGEDATEVNTILDEYVSKFNFNASAYFNDKCLLESVGLSVDASLKYSIDDQESGTKVSVDGSVKGSEELKVSYNSGKVALPSFADYKEIDLGGGEEIIVED